jgi:hypothetical protein
VKMVFKSRDPIPEMTNVVKVSDDTKERDYIYSTAIRMRPSIYNKFGCILWQVPGSKLPFAITTLYKNNVFFWGLEIDGEPKPIQIEVESKRGAGYVLNDAYEITLKKIPPIKHLTIS